MAKGTCSLEQKTYVFMVKHGCEPLGFRLHALLSWKKKNPREFVSYGMATEGARASTVNITRPGHTCTQPLDGPVWRPQVRSTDESR